MINTNDNSNNANNDCRLCANMVAQWQDAVTASEAAASIINCFGLRHWFARGLCLTRDTLIEHCHSPSFRERISEDGKAGRMLTLRLTFVCCLQASFLFISVLQRCF